MNSSAEPVVIFSTPRFSLAPGARGATLPVYRPPALGREAKQTQLSFSRGDHGSRSSPGRGAHHVASPILSPIAWPRDGRAAPPCAPLCSPLCQGRQGPSSLLQTGSLPCGAKPSPADSSRQLLEMPVVAGTFLGPPRVPSPLAHGSAGCKAELYLHHTRTHFGERGLLAAAGLTPVRWFCCDLLEAGSIPALPVHTREGGNNPAPPQLLSIRAFNWKEKLSRPSPRVTGCSPSKGFASGLCSGEFHNSFVFAKTPGWSLPSASKRGASLRTRGAMAHAAACVSCWPCARERVLLQVPGVFRAPAEHRTGQSRGG